MQFKDLIVRKRPTTAALGGADPLDQLGGPDDERGVDDFAEIAERVEAAKTAAEPTRGEIASERLRAVQAQQRQPQTRPNIWDLEDEDDDGDAGIAEDADAPEQAPADEAMDLASAAARAAEVAAKATSASAFEPARRRRGFSAVPTPAPTPKAAAPAGGGRAKTRILGFHGETMETDVLAGSRAAPTAAARFPAGWIVVLEGPGRGASFTVLSGVSTVGRGADQTISLDFGDMSISRENHASIAYDEEQNKFYVGHGGKSNIVRRNGAPVLATEELQHGDLIRIGKTTLRFVALCGPDFTWASGEDDGDGDAIGH